MALLCSPTWDRIKQAPKVGKIPMKDELASRRRTRTIEKAEEDAKASLRAFVSDLRDPQVLAHYEKETGETGLYGV